jgi:hypothetical protein
MPLERYTDIKAIPVQGGCITAIEKSSIPFGGLSQLQNMRNRHPGFQQRGGQRKLAEADGTNKVMTLYQFQKTIVEEQHFYAQMSDGDILEATSQPPAVTAGPFGEEAFSGSVNQIPASWGVMDDVLLHSNGVDQHKIYGGTSSSIEKLYVHKGSTIRSVPVIGEDYSVQISIDDDTEAILDALDTQANGHCVFFRTPLPVKSVNLTVSSPNGNASVGSIYYSKSDGSWAAASGFADATAVGGATLAQTGAMSWTMPTDIIPRYLYGSCGWWYQLRVSAALDAEVRITQVTYDTSWLDLENVWNAVVQYAVEVQVEGTDTDTWETYAAGAIDVSVLPTGNKIMIATTDPVEGIYIDPGATPNQTGTTLTSLKYWDGSSMVSVGAVEDNTNGMSNAGWIKFKRNPAHPHQFGTSQYHAFWYELIWSAEIQDDTIVTVMVMPYFDVSELGKSKTNVVWKDRACYSFNRWPAYIYVTQKDSPMVLNGSDYGILKAGDGRANAVVNMKRFHNELMVWQEEKGVEGGCVTLFEGYSPATFGKLVLSSKIGSMNAKSVAIVDGVLTATATDETIKTLAFFLSRYGVCVTDGRTISIISDDIRNYFDPTKDECIRRGYEQEMWLEHDTQDNVIRMGLVSGSDATLPNIFPVFDLVTKKWAFDTPAQELSCFANVAAGSGDTVIAQVGGGIDDGTVYQCNYGYNDVSAGIDASLTFELSDGGQVLNLEEFLLIAKAIGSGNAVIQLFENGLSNGVTAVAISAAIGSQEVRRHRIPIDRTSELISVKIGNGKKDEELYLLEAGFQVNLWTER